MPTYTFGTESNTYSFVPGTTLLAALQEQGIEIDNPCNGKGTCGKCRVKVHAENLPALTETEQRLLSAEDKQAGVRLACLIDVANGMEVEVLHTERKHEVLTTGIMPSFTFAPDGPKPSNPHEGFYGVAIDIGTTTVVCELVDMATGEVLGSASQINAQKTYGLDVLTRITYELEHPETGIANLQRAIVESLNAMISEVCTQAHVDNQEIREIVVSANCTMTHMLLGVDATSIGKRPFTPAFTAAQDVPAVSIGLYTAPEGRLYCLPQVSAYIGADIVAGTYVCELEQEPGNVLFIDIGTNGEIVLASHGKLLCCSCAAGPALEGMNISAGMRAAQGAIEEVHISEEGNHFTVIGNCEPEGLCGSGILAVMRELLTTGIVRKNGAFIKANSLETNDWRSHVLVEDEQGKRAFVLTEKPKRMLVTQSDVRQVQLAKGALLSGFTALLSEAGITMDDLDKVIVAGQFGAHLAPNSITGTGILPAEVEGRIMYAGNTSKTGAYMALMSGDVKRDMERLAEKMDYIELGETENYERLFSDCLIFPDYSKSR